MTKSEISDLISQSGANIYNGSWYVYVVLLFESLTDKVYDHKALIKYDF